MSNLTPSEIVSTLSTISREIDETTAELADLDFEQVTARQVFKRAYAESFLRTEGSMDVRRYTAELETSNLFFEYEVAEQKHRACVAHLKALRDRLEVGRSIGALVRLEWSGA